MDGKQPTCGRKITFTAWSCSFAPTVSSMATLLAILDTALIYQYRTRLIIRLPLVSVIVSTGRTDKWVILGYCQYVLAPHHSSNLAAVCASIYHTIHTLTLTLKLTLNLALISLFNELAPYIQLDCHLYNKCLGAFLLAILTIT